MKLKKENLVISGVALLLFRSWLRRSRFSRHCC